MVHRGVKVKSPDQQAELPRIQQPLMRGFRKFNRIFLRKHFHTVAANLELLKSAEIAAQDALVVYANHASWWDPLMALYMADRLFPDFKMFAPIDADAFEKYRMFGRMGFFPVARDSLKGAKDFLRVSRNILSQSGTSIWITPEGRFSDVRDHSAALMPGMAHLALQLSSKHVGQVPADSGQVNRVWFLPAAIEYVFWEERLPEALVRFGKPMHTQETSTPSKETWQERLTQGLREAQRELAEQVVARDSSAFEVLLQSKSGTFFVYDWWRIVRSRMLGKQLDVDHSALLKEGSSEKVS